VGLTFRFHRREHGVKDIIVGVHFVRSFFSHNFDFGKLETKLCFFVCLDFIMFVDHDMFADGRYLIQGRHLTMVEMRLAILVLTIYLLTYQLSLSSILLGP
jgi:hypothetical protein